MMSPRSERSWRQASYNLFSVFSAICLFFYFYLFVFLGVFLSFFSPYLENWSRGRRRTTLIEPRTETENQV